MEGLFKQGPGGGIEDLNQICDHALYKNTPLTPTSKFVVENPHLVGFILMHLEEVVRHAEKDDSVAGLMRLLFVTFPPVTNKIAPKGLSEGATKELLTTDPDYFNDLAYDDVIKCCATIVRVGQAVEGLEDRDELRRRRGRAGECEDV